MNNELVVMLLERHRELQAQADAVEKRSGEPEKQLRDLTILLGRLSEVRELLTMVGCCVYSPGSNVEH